MSLDFGWYIGLVHTCIHTHLHAFIAMPNFKMQVNRLLILSHLLLTQEIYFVVVHVHLCVYHPKKSPMDEHRSLISHQLKIYFQNLKKYQ